MSRRFRVGLVRACVRACGKQEESRLTFSAERVKLVEERREMHDDARTDDARDPRVDQPYMRTIQRARERERKSKREVLSVQPPCGLEREMKRWGVPLGRR